MTDADKTKEQLLAELAAARQRIAELETAAGAGADRGQAQVEPGAGMSFKALADHANDGILVGGQDGRHVYANRRAADLLGYSVAELLGATVADLAHPDVWEQLTDKFRRRISGQAGPERYETVLRRQDGSRLEVELSAARIPWHGQPAVLVLLRDITARKQAEAALRRSEEQLRTFFAASPDAIYLTDTAASILDANPAALQNVGLSLAELRGKSALSFYAGTDPESLARALADLQAGKEARGEVAAHTAAGELRHFEISAVPLRDNGEVTAVLNVARDITERKRTEEALRDKAQRLRSLYETMSEGVVLIAPDGRIVQANPAAERILGLTRSEIESRSYVAPEWEIVREDGTPMPPGEMAGPRAMQEQLPVRGQVMGVRRPDGDISWISVSAVPLTDEAGSLQGAVGTFADITQRKRAEAEQRRLQAQVQHAQKLESLGILAGGIAHDFNNLLTTMLGNVDLALLDLPFHSPARPLLYEIRQAGRRAAALTGQMLAYTGKGKLIVEDVDLNALIRDMSSLLASSTSKKVQLSFELAADLPAVRADASQLRQILLNLICNGSEAIGEQGGLVRVRTYPTSLADSTGWAAGLTPAAGRYVALEVSDTGCGLDEETKAKIFDPFFTTKFTGRGLGLAAVQGIVRGHQGAILVDSEPGRGTTFQVLLPASDQPAVPAGARTPEGDSWQGAGTVLLVDDEQLVRVLATRLLKRLGFTVLTATDGAEAVELFRERHSEIACVLLDLKMPRMDGAEALAELCRIDGGVPVILTSGFGEEESTERLSDQCLAGFLEKPYDLARLREELQLVLGEVRRRAP